MVSIAKKVASLAGKKPKSDIYFLSGGFSNSEYIIELLEKYLNSKVYTDKDGQFAGAIGASLSI